MKNLLSLIAFAVVISFVMVPLTYAADRMPEGTKQFQQQNSDKAQQGQGLINEQSMKSQTQQQMQQTPGTTVKGALLKTDGEFYTIHDASGHEVRVHVDKNTKLDGSMPFIVGDKVEAQVTAQGHANSMKHIAAAK
ncbi:MAG TPA: hypothetical protein VJ746_07655 [Nitrospira sp.]|nr:hypothetical protein [Nitrospira sp.]